MLKVLWLDRCPNRSIGSLLDYRTWSVQAPYFTLLEPTYCTRFIAFSRDALCPQFGLSLPIFFSLHLPLTSSILFPSLSPVKTPPPSTCDVNSISPSQIHAFPFEPSLFLSYSGSVNCSPIIPYFMANMHLSECIACLSF